MKPLPARRLPAVIASLALVFPAAAQELPAASLPAAPPPDTVDCPDPAAVSFDVTDVSVRTVSGTPSYLFRLTGLIRNLGTEYRAAANQQRIEIQRIAVGASFGSVVGSVNLPVLAAGREQEVVSSFIQGWQKNDSTAPSFAFVITYAPGLAEDANPANDDCRLDNNRLTLSAAEVNARLP